MFRSLIYYYKIIVGRYSTRNEIVSKLFGLYSSVGIVTRCGLDRPRIECRWGARFSAPSRPALRLTQPFIQWVISGCKAAGAWR